MKKRMTFALAAAMFASTLSAFPHVAAAKPTAPPPPPPQGLKGYPLPKFHNDVVTGLMDGILSVLLR
jgi:Spy/CpxP family protein refolding chaperone